MTLYLQTLGCRLNQAEAARFAADFSAAGFTIVDSPADATLCLIHSCTITRQAERQSLRLIRHCKAARPAQPPLVIFSGCAVTTSSTSHLNRAGADLTISHSELPHLLPRALTLLGQVGACSPSAPLEGGAPSPPQCSTGGRQALATAPCASGTAYNGTVHPRRPAPRASATYGPEGPASLPAKACTPAPAPGTPASRTSGTAYNSQLTAYNGAVHPRRPAPCASAFYPRQGSQSLGCHNPPLFKTRRALLRVQDGCDFHCAYCIVPYTRGTPTSRNWQEVCDEAEQLLQAGHRELVITGCNLACYHDHGRRLPELTHHLCQLAAACHARIRLGSVEPGLVETELAALIATTHNLCRSLHLPIQSASDTVLQRMGRRYDLATLHTSLGNIRQRLPDLALGTDLITGLPGEDQSAFEATLSLVTEFGFANLHVFPYSPRSGTPAATMQSRPPVKLARERARHLRQLGHTIRRQYARRWLGRPVEVLLEGTTPDGLRHGWSDTYLPCLLHAPDRPDGHLVTFVPTSLHTDHLIG